MTSLVLLALVVSQTSASGPQSLATAAQDGIGACVARQRAWSPAASEAFLQLKCGSATAALSTGDTAAELAEAAPAPLDPADRAPRHAAPMAMALMADVPGEPAVADLARPIGRAIALTFAGTVATSLMVLSPASIPVVYVLAHWALPPWGTQADGLTLAAAGILLTMAAQMMVGAGATAIGVYLGLVHLSTLPALDGRPALRRPSTLALAAGPEE
jgi:hypothetical protein